MKPSELMRACGSKSGSFEPESVDHWVWQLRNGEGPERALAWVKLKSIAHGSPFCVDEAGRALTIESMAADLGWKEQTARNNCSLLAAEGRIRTQKGRIWYRADVPESATDESEEVPEKYRVQSIFPAYLHEFIESLPPQKRAVIDAFCAWHDDFLADGVRSLRSIVERVQDTTLAQVGCKQKRIAKTKPQESRFLQLQLVEEPNFVHGQAPAPVNGLHKAAAASVQSVSGSGQSRASLLSSDPDPDSKREAAPTASGGGARSGKAAAAHVVPLDQINAVCDRCKVLGLQLPDRNLVVALLTRFAGLDPLRWPKFPDQVSPGLWLRKTREQLAAEIERQANAHLNGAKPKSAETYERLVARAKQAGGVS